MSAWNQTALSFVAEVADLALRIRETGEHDFDRVDLSASDSNWASVPLKWFAAGATSVAIPDELFRRWATTDSVDYKIPPGTESMLVLLPDEFGFVLYVREEFQVSIFLPNISEKTHDLVLCDQALLDTVLQNPAVHVHNQITGAREWTGYGPIPPHVHALIRVALLTQLAIETDVLRRAGVERSGKQINQDNRRVNRNRRKADKPELPKANEACPEVQLFTFGKDLAAKPKHDPDLDEAILHAIRTGEHKYKSRFWVRGHVQLQVCGKAKDDPHGNNKPLWDKKKMYHEPYWSGAKKGPLLVRAEIMDTSSPGQPTTGTEVDDGTHRNQAESLDIHK
jgi:hypothetical protein